MSEPSDAAPPEDPPDRYMEWIGWWALGVVDGYHGHQQHGIGEPWLRYVSGWAQGMRLRDRRGHLDAFLVASQVPHREIHFRPRPRFLPGERDERA